MSSDRAVEPCTHATILHALQARAREQPQAYAYTFLHRGGEQRRVTCEALYAQVCAIARELGARVGARDGREQPRALLVYPPGLDYVCAFLGALMAGVVAVPIYPPDPSRLGRTLPRFVSVVEDCQPDFVLTTKAVAQLAPALFQTAPQLESPTWIATDELASGREVQELELPEVGPDTTAMLQYTSGSTGDPKGVIVSHANLRHNMRLIQIASECDASSRLVSWLPQYHDMGLVTGILVPLFVGFEAILMSPIEFLKWPNRWLEAISHYRATHSGGPPFAFHHCVRRLSAKEVASLDLSCWQVAYVGAEPNSMQTLDKFASTFASAGFRREAYLPCYGLAEATVGVAWIEAGAPPTSIEVSRAELERGRAQPPTAGDATVLVSCGKPRLDQRVVIVDPETGVPQPERCVGEIWVAGPSVCGGYLGQPESSAATFRATLADGSGPYLRTGDLGFEADAELYVCGRMKDLIIVAGQNIYPQDIERTIEECDEAIRPGCCAAFSLEVDDGPALIVVATELRRSFVAGLGDARASALEELAGQIRRVVSRAYEIRVAHVFFVEEGHIPKTSSGKIRRRACRDAFVDETLRGEAH